LLDLPSIADKMKHKVRKAFVWKQRAFRARCHMTDWRNRLSEVWPWPSLSSSFTKAITTITVPNFPIPPHIECFLPSVCLPLSRFIFLYLYREVLTVVDWFTALRFTVTGTPPTVSQIWVLSMNEHAWWSIMFGIKGNY
jgi:hypothetical protein